MNYTFSVVVDVSLSTLSIHTEESKNFTAAIHGDTFKLIQNTLANALKIREPSPDDIVIKLWNSNYITEKIKTSVLSDTNKKNTGKNSIASINNSINNSINSDQKKTCFSFSQQDSHSFSENLNNDLESSTNLLKETDYPAIEDKEILLSSPEALKYLTKYEAQKMQVFPLRLDKDSFVCATITSQDFALINKLRLRTGKKILCIVFPLHIILDSIENAYPNINDTADRNALLSLLHR